MRSPALLLVLSLVALAAGCAALTPAPPPEQDAELRMDRGLAALGAGHYAEAFDDLAWVYTHCSGRTAGSHALLALAALDLDPRNRAARPEVGTELLGRVIRDPGTPDWLRPMAETAFLTGLALGAPHPEGVPAPDPAPDTAVTTDALERPDSLAPADSLPPADSLAPARAEPDTVPAVTEREGMAGPPVPGPAPTAMESVSGCGPRIDVGGRDRVASSLPTLPGPSMATILARSEAIRDSVSGRADALQSELASVRDQLEATQAELERIRRTLKP